MDPSRYSRVRPYRSSGTSQSTGEAPSVEVDSQRDGSRRSSEKKSGMPTDKMQRFMNHAQSTVELRKKNGKGVSNPLQPNTPENAQGGGTPLQRSGVVPPASLPLPLETGPMRSMPQQKDALQSPPEPSQHSSFSSLSMEEIPQFIHPETPSRKRSQGISVNSDVSAASSIHRSGSVDYHPSNYPTRPSSSKPSAGKSEAISASEDEVESALNASTPNQASAEKQRSQRDQRSQQAQQAQRSVKEVKVVRRRPVSRGTASAVSQDPVDPMNRLERLERTEDASHVRTSKKSSGARRSRMPEASSNSSLKERSTDRYVSRRVDTLQLSGDSSGDEDDTQLPRERTTRLVSSRDRVLASDSSESFPSMRRAGSIDSTATSHSVIVKRPRGSPKRRRQAIEQFVTDVETELRGLRESYDAAYEQCVQTLQDTQGVQTMLEEVKNKDSVERNELNQRLGMRFDREVNARTRKISDMIAETSEEIEVMKGMKSTSTVDKVLSFVFSSILEGLSWIGLIPLIILSFLKHVLMILIATHDEPIQTRSDRFHIRHEKQDALEDSDT